ncbi:hypothetical protein FHX37_3358 [Haloactinospora alba]|uniref:Uncharacterized protein n=1 Tax=Haloactinospora alba TaxID=405555 RepID=A0A543NND9_9ACTN|nr:hypothetical protein [Haloactinospora alba]TQN33343.1 hypothetical protein FHX37_3358 [Haloactinospora alba]
MSQEQDPPTSIRWRPRNVLLAVLATALLTGTLGYALARSDVVLSTTVVQRETSADAGVTYEPGGAFDPRPAEVFLVRTRGTGGTGHELRLGHDAGSYFHRVPVPAGTGTTDPPRIDGVDWDPGSATVRLTSGYAVTVDAEKFVGLR